MASTASAARIRPLVAGNASDFRAQGHDVDCTLNGARMFFLPRSNVLEDACP